MLPGQYPLQIQYAYDIGSPAYGQLQKLHKVMTVIMIMMMIIITVIIVMVSAYLLICDTLRPEATLEHTAGVVRTGEAETLS